jgi:hypothetical protein
MRQNWPISEMRRLMQTMSHTTPLSKEKHIFHVSQPLNRHFDPSALLKMQAFFAGCITIPVIYLCFGCCADYYPVSAVGRMRAGLKVQ